MVTLSEDTIKAVVSVLRDELPNSQLEYRHVNETKWLTCGSKHAWGRRMAAELAVHGHVEMRIKT